MTAPQPLCPHLHIPEGDPVADRIGAGAVALRYAWLGLPVFPLKKNRKTPDCKNGLLDATTDPAVLVPWWEEERWRGVGLRMGRPPGADLGWATVDLDRKNGNDCVAAFGAWLAELGLSLPWAPWADTPGLGMHVQWRLPQGLTLASKNGGLPGVDLKADGGYVVAWPSRVAERTPPSPERHQGEVMLGTYTPHGCWHQAPVMPLDLFEALAALHGTSAGGGGGHGGNGGGELPPTDVLLERGVEHPHDDNLAALTARLARQGKTEAEAYAIWQAVVDKTATDPADPYARGHFTRMWRGAKAKFPAAEVTPDAMAWAASTVPGAFSAPVVPVTCAEAEAVYSRWLHDPDPVPTRVVLAAYVANMFLDGDPVWVMLVGGSGIGKTVRIIPLSALPHVVMASTLTGEAALLSASPKRERAKNATGGVLRQIGERGILVVKDFTSVLSMSRDRRAEVIAALREIYDGRWDRFYGADGGQVLPWAGHCGFIAGCTTAIDSAHSVLDVMGTRFLFVRLPDADASDIGGSALAQAGQEQQMHAELAQVTAGLMGSLGPPHELHEGVRPWLVALAALASRARSPVERDYQGEISLVGDAEAPTRIIKQLGQLWKACGMLGLDEDASWAVVRRAGLDSVPKLRRAVIDCLGGEGDVLPTTGVARAVRHPARTTLRTLGDLDAHGLVVRHTEVQGARRVIYSWELSPRAASWWSSLNPVPEKRA